MDDAALEEVRGLLGAGERRRDLLIEYLHQIQDRFGHIQARHLAALAADLRLAQAEVYEVATFYAHFDVVKEGEQAPAPLTVRVCGGIACELAGGGDLHDSLADALDGNARIVRAPCLGACHQAPVAVVGRRRIVGADNGKVKAAMAAADNEPEIPAYKNFDAYRADGGYDILAACQQGERSREAIIGAVEASGLRGLGGGGFPVARKWRFLLDAPKPRLLVVNADEGEPGTFKDRHCLGTDPHRILEGALIAAWAVEAEEVYIYLRDEYPDIREILIKEIAKAETAAVTDGAGIHLRRGAGAYICGEETALLESLEGKRGLPRNRPPYPVQRGLFSRPTLIHNVETLYWLREIFECGGDWYTQAGRPRFYSVSGRVKEPGVKLAPAGVTAGQLIEDHCGGMADGHRFKAYLPGGASGGILPASEADLPLGFGALDEHGCFVGSAAVVVLSDQDDIRAVVRNLLRFFAEESCGQCTPCRVGCEKMLGLMEPPVWNPALMTELSELMRDASICGLGQAAPNPVLCALKFFPGEVK